MKRVFNEFARSTLARDAQLRAVRDRLPLLEDPEASVRTLLGGVLGTGPGAVDRVRARLAFGTPSRLPAVLALAASFLFAFGGASLAIWVATPTPLNAALAASAVTSVHPAPHVSLRYSGDGLLRGNDEAPVIEWARGDLSVEVDPGQGVQLSVVTAEAEVKVIGTGFDVRRDALGTRVEVVHGQVAVVCVGGSGVLLQSGQSAFCAPTTAAGLLGRAQALRDAGEPAMAVLDVVERGLAADPDVALRIELSLLRAEALGSLGRHVEALRFAEAALGEATGDRKLELQHIAAREAVRAEGCTAALPHLRSLRDLGAGSAVELVLLADCAAPVDAVEARAALVAALAMGMPSEQVSAVAERLVRLGGAP